MNLPLLILLQNFDKVTVSGDLIWEEPHEKAKDAFQQCFQINDGLVILTIWQQKLHEIIYQTPQNDEMAIKERNSGLFNHYGEGFGWKGILDNGFGKTYRRIDMQRYAFGVMQWISIPSELWSFTR